MKKNKISKKIITSLLLVGALSTLSLPTFAAEDNYGYSFSIKTHQNNTYGGDAKYRQTTNTSNKWKVELSYSGEGKGTGTRFWLVKDNISKTQVSTSTIAYQGGGAKYTDAYNDASKQYVKLGAENNNYSANSYTVSGYWDEEIN